MEKVLSISFNALYFSITLSPPLLRIVSQTLDPRLLYCLMIQIQKYAKKHIIVPKSRIIFKLGRKCVVKHTFKFFFNVFSRYICPIRIKQTKNLLT